MDQKNMEERSVYFKKDETKEMNLDSGQKKRIAEFNNICRSMNKWIEPKNPCLLKNRELLWDQIIDENIPMEDVFVRLLTVNGKIRLKDAFLEIIDTKDLFLLFQELLINEEYFIHFDTEEPVIIDGGVNIGLAIYYFKTLYPKCRIIGFEPWDKAYRVACANVKNNHWNDVEILPYGLSDKDEEYLFSVNASNSLGGKIVQNGEQDNQNASKVVCRRLSPYIKEHVHFLKLDIEGMETKVFREIAEKLDMVDNIFCEFHFSKELSASGNSLAEILRILEEKNFVYEVSRSYAYTKVTIKKPMWHVGRNVSMLVFAKQK